MTARKKILAGLVILAVAAVATGVVWQLLRPEVPDPIYQGRPLSAWLDGIGSQIDEARAAVNHAGTNSIPLLLQLMRARDSRLKRWLIALVVKQQK